MHQFLFWNIKKSGNFLEGDHVSPAQEDNYARYEGHSVYKCQIDVFFSFFQIKKKIRNIHSVQIYFLIGPILCKFYDGIINDVMIRH